MITTTHQPIFLPWPGFFYKCLRADVVVLLDQVQFPLGRSWNTRNRLKCDKGELWLRVPVWKKRRGKQIIRNVEICDETGWRRDHLTSIRQQYANAPYAAEYYARFESIYEHYHKRLVDLNVDLIRYLWDVLGMDSKLVLQSDLGASGVGTDLLISVCRAVNADRYVTLPLVEKYLDTEKFLESNIELVLTRFRPPVYPQLWGDFRYNLSVLDLLFNCGPKALEIIERQH